MQRFMQELKFFKLRDEYANKIVNDQINVGTVKNYLVEYGNKLVLYANKDASSTISGLTSM
jgi:hypothetical protein